MMMLMGNSRLPAILTVAFSVPLFFTYAIKHGLFPQGYVFVAMYSAALVSVVVVPILLTVELTFAGVTFRRRRGEIFRWHAGAVLIAGIAEIVFLVARRL
jgi:hypothetical protein